jgi:hypothetical protein
LKKGEDAGAALSLGKSVVENKADVKGKMYRKAVNHEW